MAWWEQDGNLHIFILLRDNVLEESIIAMVSCVLKDEGKRATGWREKKGRGRAQEISEANNEGLAAS